MAIRLNAELHEGGEGARILDWRVVQSAAWWIASELMRRHPGKFFAFETGGEYQYDVIAVNWIEPPVDTEKQVVWMNMMPAGHLTTGTWFADSASTERFNWLDVIGSANRIEYVICQIEREAGLASPQKVPATRRSTIAARVISGFLDRTIWNSKSWVARCASATSGMGEASHNSGPFRSIPGMSDAAPTLADDAVLSASHFRHWFLCPTVADESAATVGSSMFRPAAGPPKIGFDLENGLCWNGTGDPIDLMGEYEKVGRSVDALISRVCPPAF